MAYKLRSQEGTSGGQRDTYRLRWRRDVGMGRGEGLDQAYKEEVIVETISGKISTTESNMQNDLSFTM